MLQTIRDRAQGVFAWIILILISVPFVLWGIQNYFDTGKERPVAVVGDREFFQRDWARTYEEIRSQLPADQASNEERLRRQALDKLIRQEVISQAADVSGISIGDETVRDLIQSLPAFGNEGKFNREKYHRLLAAQGLTSLQFTEQVRRSLAMEQYRKAILESAFITPDSMDWFFRQQNQKRKIEYFTIPLAEIQSEPDESMIETFYRENQSQFETPEIVSIEYVELNLDDLAKEVEYTEDDLKAFYEEQKDYYTQEERRKVSHILIEVPAEADETAVAKAQNKIQQIQTRIKNGEPFASVAKETSADKLTAKQGGDLGFINKGVMVKSFEDAAFALTEGAVSEPTRTKYGLHLIKVTDLEPAKVKPFVEVRQELLTNYRRNEVENSFYQAGENLAESSYENPDTLKPVAEQLGLTIKTIQSVTREKGDGIASDPKIRDAAFSEDVIDGNNSVPVELSNERVVVLRKTAYQPAKVKPLSDVRKNVVVAVRNEKARQLTVEKAERLFNELRSGKAISELAKQTGYNLEQPEPFQRNDAKIPPAIIQAVFKAPKPEKGKTTPINVDSPDGKVALVALLQVQEGDAKQVEANQYESAEKFMVQAESQLEFDALISRVKEKIGVTENPTPE